MSIPTSLFPTITRKNNLPAAAAGDPVRRIIGVDPGLAAAGWGVIEVIGSRTIHVAHGCIETKAGVPRAERLLTIYKSLQSRA